MNVPSNTPARMRSNARARSNGSVATRRCARRAGVVAIALLAVTAAGFAYGTAAGAATIQTVMVGPVPTVPSVSTGSGSLASPLEALGESIDALLYAVLPHPGPDEDSDGDGPQFDGPQFDSPQFGGREHDGPEHEGAYENDPYRDGASGDEQNSSTQVPVSPDAAPHNQR
jgi:hypothetical protein